MSKKKILFILLSVCYLLPTDAQTLYIKGSPFSVKLNERQMTATLYDYKYVIDDRDYPLFKKERNFKELKKGNLSNRQNVVTIPQTYEAHDGKQYVITAIGKAAFAGYQNVDEFIIPPTVTSIDDYAFFRTSIQHMVIPGSVQEMGKRVFGYCGKLKELRLPQGLTCEAVSYKESKNLEPSYYLPENQPAMAARQTPAAKEKKKEEKKVAFASTSDVDENLPQTAKQNNNTFAVIIGNEDYVRVADVPYAGNDAKIFAEYCQKTLGLPERNIRRYDNATYGMMLSAVSDIRDIAKVYKGDLDVIFYYAGHGVPNEKTLDAFLLPVDADGRQTEVCYPVSRLYKELGEMGARRVVVFMDACFSGSQRGDGMLASARGVAIKVRRQAPQGNMVVFSAASADETAFAYQEKEHGLFTYFLLKALQETSGGCTLGELSDYIQQHVSRRSIVVNRKTQTPSISVSTTLGNSWKSFRLR